MRFVTDAQMQQIVAEVHERAGQTHAPFDPVAAAKKLGVRVFNTQFADSATSGVFRRGEDGTCEIHIDRDAPRNRARFTAAHELGHWQLHREQVGAVIDSDVNMYRRDRAGAAPAGADRSREFQANLFAVEFLMPAERVRQAFALTRDVTTLARLFGVSEEAMGYRVTELDLGD